MSITTQTQTTQVLRMPQTVALIGLCRSTIYTKINPASRHYDSSFPRPVKLGVRSVGFYAHEIQAWLDALQRKNG